MSGLASRERGVKTERMEVRWFRANGFPQADRLVRTGYRVAERELPDGGDIGLCPGVIVASKSLRPANRMERAVPGWLAETETQRIAAGAEVALLVVRRDGTADVGEWWCWVPFDVLVRFAVAFERPMPDQLNSTLSGFVGARLFVADACRLIRAAGYGDPLEVTG